MDRANGTSGCVDSLFYAEGHCFDPMESPEDNSLLGEVKDGSCPHEEINSQDGHGPLSVENKETMVHCFVNRSEL